MSEQKINIGTVPNDGTGDPLRTAFIKVDGNFDELYGDNANVVNSINLLLATSSGLVNAANTLNLQLIGATSNIGNVYLQANAAYVAGNNAGLAANVAGIVANNIGYYANTTLGPSANNFANTKLANTTNTVFAGNFLTSNGVYAIGNYTGPFTDGIIMDYAAGVGRFTAGTLDSYSFYNNYGNPTLLSSISSTGAFTTAGGLYSLGTYTGIYSDGIVVDYVTGGGRISVGGSDTITFYNSGVGAVPLATMTSILGAGYFGIGTASPASPFTVISNGAVQIALAGGLADFEGNTNSTIQLNIRNANTFSGASSDLIATADNGSDSSNFIDLGINGSQYSVVGWSINGATDGYLYTNDGALAIGTANTTIKKPLQFFVGGTTISNEAMRISNTSNVGIGTTNPQATLDVNGSINVSSSLVVGGQNFGTVLSAAFGKANTALFAANNKAVLAKANPYGLAITDVGSVVAATGGIFVPNAVFSAGNTMYIFNNTSASITITQNTNVSLRGGGLTTGNRTLAANGLAQIICVQGIESGANVFVMSGTGLT